MKVVILWSSPNVDGLTAEAKNRFLSGLALSGIENMEVEELDEEVDEEGITEGEMLDLILTEINNKYVDYIKIMEV